MPTLNWIGKEKIITHHLDVPFRVLEHLYDFNSKNSSENKIIKGDNLEALKALLPEYEGRIKCVYIDPPYNTGNENWVYNDNVNSQKIRKWLGSVVGKENEDLTRHDKWLCMMYPRLMLLHKLLADDGVIFISLDENETVNLRCIMDEIFGENNFVAQLILLCNPKGRSQDKYFSTNHEYITVYSKKPRPKDSFSITKDEALVGKEYKFSDAYGKYRLLELRNTHREFNKVNRPNLFYSFFADPKTGKVCTTKSDTYYIELLPLWPDGYEGCWTWGKELAEKDNHLLVAIESKNRWKVYRKSYAVNPEGEGAKKKLFSILQDPRFYTEKGQAAFGELFPGLNKNDFPQPKSPELIKELLMTSTNSDDIILDSFAGSGTTADAVLTLNKEDGGNRKFILIEMEEYARTITAERVKRVLARNGQQDAGFSFYELGEQLFTGEHKEDINESAGIEQIREYIWYCETRTRYHKNSGDEGLGFLGKKNDTAYYFFYQPGVNTTLDFDALSKITIRAGQYVFYANNCLLPEEYIIKKNIVFKKLSKDIMRF